MRPVRDDDYSLLDVHELQMVCNKHVNEDWDNHSLLDVQMVCDVHLDEDWEAQNDCIVHHILHWWNNWENIGLDHLAVFPA